MSEDINLGFLEDIVEAQEEAGRKWADAKQISTRMEELKKTLLAKLMNDIGRRYETTGTKITESKLEREALASKEYIDHINSYAESVGIELGARTHYEAVRNHFEARRSWVSLEKAKTQMV